MVTTSLLQIILQSKDNKTYDYNDCIHCTFTGHKCMNQTVAKLIVKCTNQRNKM